MSEIDEEKRDNGSLENDGEGKTRLELEEIILLRIKKRRDENEALRKILTSLNTTDQKER